VTFGRVAVIGDIIRDTVVSPRGPIQRDTDTPARIDSHLGGSAANTALWLGHEGIPVSFFGRAGARDVPAIEDHLRRFGVEPALQSDLDHPTGSIVVIVDGASRTMLTDRGANTFLDAADISIDLATDTGFLHLTGYSFFHTPSPDALLDVVDRARRAGVVVLMDCSSVGFLADFGSQRWWDVLSLVDIVRGNADEAALITGISEPAGATADIAARGYTAVITRGSEGAVWCEPGGQVHSCSAAPLGPAGYVDPTGAGDSFSAGFLAGLSRGHSLSQAVDRGLLLSARVVGQWGAGPT